MKPDHESRIQQAITHFWRTIPPLWHHLRSQIDSAAEENFSLTSEQFHSLRRISLGIDSVSRLAVDKKISRSAVSRAVDVLVQKELVLREPDPDDRRRDRLILTDKGQDALQTTNRIIDAWLADRFTNLSEAGLENLIEALNNLDQAFPHGKCGPEN